VAIICLKYSCPYGNNGNPKRINPYIPNFKSNAAKITEPIVGASTWASGNQI
jgi:hypothetical protein